MNANWLMMSKMCQQSHMSELDVKLLFRKAQKTVKKAELKARVQHQKLAVSAEQCLEHFTEERVTEEAVDAAYNGIRYHNSTTEPYYWEQAYRALHDADVAALPVDGNGRVHVFAAVVAKNVEQQDEDTAKECENDRHTSVK